jgi:hypothetical protein
MVEYSKEDWESLGKLPFESNWAVQAIDMLSNGESLESVIALCKKRALIAVSSLYGKADVDTFRKAENKFLEFPYLLLRVPLEDLAGIDVESNSDIALAVKWRLSRGV